MEQKKTIWQTILHYTTPNKDQMEWIIRWLITNCSIAFATWVAAKTGLNADQILEIIKRPEVVTVGSGLLLSIALFIHGLFINTKASLVATVDAIPEVSGVVMKPTAKGEVLAENVDSRTVVVGDVKKAEGQ